MLRLFCINFRGQIGESGSAMHSFEFKGIVYVPISTEKSLSKDDALEAAIEAGAEDVREGADDDDRPAYLVFHFDSYCFLFNICTV